MELRSFPLGKAGVRGNPCPRSGVALVQSSGTVVASYGTAEDGRGCEAPQSADRGTRARDLLGCIAVAATL